MFNKLWCPKSSSFMQPIVASLGAFSYSYTQFTFANSGYLRNQTEPVDSNQIQDTILLTSSFFIIGAYIGNYLIIHLLESTRPRLLFFIADLILIFSSSTVLLLMIPGQGDEVSMLNIFYISRMLAGLGNGMNLALTLIYIKQTTTKRSFPLFVIFVPLLIQFGSLVAVIVTIFDDNSKKYFVFSQLLPILPALIRIILFLTKIKQETPHHYFFVEKDQKATLNALECIHNLTQNSRRNYESQLIWQSNNNNQQQKGSLLKQTSAGPQFQMQKLASEATLYNNFLPDNLYSSPFQSLFAKSVLMIMFTQLSGIHVVTNDSNFMYQIQGYTWLFVGILISVLTVILNLFLSQIINRVLLITIGQISLSIGLILFAVQIEFYPIKYIATSFYFFGYSLGMGTYVFILVPQFVPDIGVLQSNLFQWFFIILCQCLVAIYNNREFVQKNDQSQVYQATMYYFFGVSVLGVFVLYFLLKVYINYLYLKQRPKSSKRYGTSMKEVKSESNKKSSSEPVKEDSYDN